jgi:nicotinic acid phosphoribosyltransferase
MCRKPHTERYKEVAYELASCCDNLRLITLLGPYIHTHTLETILLKILLQRKRKYKDLKMRRWP